MMVSLRAAVSSPNMKRKEKMLRALKASCIRGQTNCHREQIRGAILHSRVVNTSKVVPPDYCCWLHATQKKGINGENFFDKKKKKKFGISLMTGNIEFRVE